jgi:hypothetical protein
MKPLLFEKYGGYEVICHHDPSESRLVFEERSDDSDIAEAAKILSDKPPGKEFRHLARIPMSVLNEAARDGWLHDKAAWKKWYMNPDNRDFRVHAGRDANFHSMLISGG